MKPTGKGQEPTDVTTLRQAFDSLRHLSETKQGGRDCSAQDSRCLSQIASASESSADDSDSDEESESLSDEEKSSESDEASSESLRLREAFSARALSAAG